MHLKRFCEIDFQLTLLLSILNATPNRFVTGTNHYLELLVLKIQFFYTADVLVQCIWLIQLTYFIADCMELYFGSVTRSPDQISVFYFLQNSACRTSIPSLTVCYSVPTVTRWDTGKSLWGDIAELNWPKGYYKLHNMIFTNKKQGYSFSTVVTARRLIGCQWVLLVETSKFSPLQYFFFLYLIKLPLSWPTKCLSSILLRQQVDEQWGRWLVAGWVQHNTSETHGSSVGSAWHK